MQVSRNHSGMAVDFSDDEWQNQLRFARQTAAWSCLAAADRTCGLREEFEDNVEGCFRLLDVYFITPDKPEGRSEFFI